MGHTADNPTYFDILITMYFGYLLLNTKKLNNSIFSASNFDIIYEAVFGVIDVLRAP